MSEKKNFIRTELDRIQNPFSELINAKFDNKTKISLLITLSPCSNYI